MTHTHTLVGFISVGALLVACSDDSDNATAPSSSGGAAGADAGAGGTAGAGGMAGAGNGGGGEGGSSGGGTGGTGGSGGDAGTGGAGGQPQPVTIDLTIDPNGILWDAADDALYLTDDTDNQIVKWTVAGGFEPYASLPTAPAMGP